MLWDVPAMVKSGLDVFANFFKKQEVKITHQAETEIIKENRTYEKAIDYAEKIIDLLENSNGYLNDKDIKTFNHLKEKFDKYKR